MGKHKALRTLGTGLLSQTGGVEEGFLEEELSTLMAEGLSR